MPHNPEIVKVIEQIEANKITHLKLSFRKIDLEDFAAVAQALKNNSSIKQLNIDFPIGDEGAEIVADIIKGNKFIKIFDLQKADAIRKGAEEIAKALKYNNSITTFIMNPNHLDNLGAKAFADVLKVNQSISEFELFSCHIDSEGRTELVNAVKGNKNITAINLGKNFGLLNESNKDWKDIIINNKNIIKIGTELTVNFKKAIKFTDFLIKNKGELPKESIRSFYTGLMEREAAVKHCLNIKLNFRGEKDDEIQLLFAKVRDNFAAHLFYNLGVCKEDSGDFKQLPNEIKKIIFQYIVGDEDTIAKSVMKKDDIGNQSIKTIKDKDIEPMTKYGEKEIDQEIAPQPLLNKKDIGNQFIKAVRDNDIGAIKKYLEKMNSKEFAKEDFAKFKKAGIRIAEDYGKDEIVNMIQKPKGRER